MPTPTSRRKSDREEIDASDSAIAQFPGRRLALVRILAAAYIVAAALIARFVAGNLAQGLAYAGGPMGYFGAQSVGLAGCLNTMPHLNAWDARQFL
jgi:hypothetical protein